MLSKIGLAVVVVFLLIGYGFASAPNNSERRVQALVVFEEKPSKADIDWLESQGAVIQHEYKIIPGVALNIPQQVIDRIRGRAGVRFVELDSIVHATAKPENPGKPKPEQPPQEVPWGIDRIDADLAWSYNNGTGVKVAVLDTGIDKDHPDLDDNFVAGVSFSAGPPGGKDQNGHGTHVAGTVAAENNEIGVVGAGPRASLYAVRVLNKEGWGWVSDVIAGIDWSVQNGMQIITMSLGSDSDSQSLHDACDNAYSSGLLLIAAAGNDGDEGEDYPGGNVDYPARYSSVIAVAATDINDGMPAWSSYGPEVELAAPGVGVKSTWLDDGYATLDGTSMATPHVTGTAALILAKNPTLTNEDARNILQTTAEDLGEEGFDVYYGYGLVDAEKATLSS